MTRLIDADVMLEELNDKEVVIAQQNIADWIDEQPTIDAEPIRCGKWIPVEGSDFRDNSIIGFKCSECGRVEYKQQPYCNCGAKMG